jgi:BASS family bile acid:Na+ symporter
MALLTCGTILFMPFALPFLIPGLKADPWSIAQPLLLLIVSPLVAGMLIKKTAPSVAAHLSPVLAIVSNVSLLLLVVLLIGLNLPALRSVIGSGSLLAAILYVVGLFAVGWMLPGLPQEVRGVLALAGAARNFGAALVPAATNFKDDPKITIGLIVNAVAGIVLSFLAAAWLRRRTRNGGLQAAA